jgi:hypothetical protein
MHHLIVGSSETTAQITVRLVLLLLISLGALAIAFDLDVVLGAFAAGFVLRRALPDGDESLEHKLEGLAFGPLIPIFFITSGMTIDPAAIAANPLGLLIFVLAILVISRRSDLSVESHGARPSYPATRLQWLAKHSDCAVRRNRLADHRCGHGRCCEIGTYESLERIAARRRRRDHRSAVADDRSAAGAPTPRASHGRQRYEG